MGPARYWTAVAYDMGLSDSQHWPERCIYAYMHIYIYVYRDTYTYTYICVHICIYEHSIWKHTMHTAVCVLQGFIMGHVYLQAMIHTGSLEVASVLLP